MNLTFGDGYEFEIEDVCAGGIVFKKFPGKTDKMYKKFQFTETRGNAQWPIEEMKDSNNYYIHGPRVVFRYKEIMHTLLKALDGAPCWTRWELTKFAECLSCYGLKKIGPYPSISRLNTKTPNLLTFQ